ncbi:hypothetical protein XA68_18332 [Ophiocordyceps unilateralis]|uniref:chitinase n=1 Tax=Ophiocordyceps unilateralis TaxID=268505 RepID=A0A2A9PJ59_OPHUN|nr:hypothetical protein XA68_18332 [Ophiocordyceps unilateralis]
MGLCECRKGREWQNKTSADERRSLRSVSSDPYADVQKIFNHSSNTVPGKNACGCVEQMYVHKMKNRKLKTILSIGGYTASQNGQFAVAMTDEGRATMASSAVALMSDWGMDGIDIDWEYPKDEAEAVALVKLLKALRESLTKLQTSQNQTYNYLLTVATSAGPDKYNLMKFSDMDRYLDGWNLMAYDYAGSWDKTTGHQANLYTDTNNLESTKFSTDQAVKDYTSHGIAPNKIKLGLPLYGRSFTHTSGLGQPYSGTGTPPEQGGTMLYRNLPLPGASVELNKSIGSAWSFDKGKGTLVSHDTVNSTQIKAQYIRDKTLGGAFFWEASGDKDGSQSLVDTMARHLSMLETTDNQLDYPASRYENIRNAMGTRA